MLKHFLVAVTVAGFGTVLSSALASTVDIEASTVEVDVSTAGIDEPVAEASPSAGPSAEPQQNCATNAARFQFSSAWPSEVQGAVGASHIVVVTNQTIGIFNKKTCALIKQSTFRDLFGGATTGFTPVALYDARAKRFFVAIVGSDTQGQYVHYAVSKNSAPTAWHTFKLKLSGTTGANFCLRSNDSIPGRLVVGQTANRWLLTFVDFDSDSKTVGAALSITKTPTLTGNTPTAKCFKALPEWIVPANVLDTNTTAYFLSPAERGTVIKRYALTAASANATSDVLQATAAITVEKFATPPLSAPQQNGEKIEIGDARFQRASTQIGAAIWNVHAVGIGGLARWRLYRFTATALRPQFTYTPPAVNGAHQFNPSVAVRSLGGDAYVTYSYLRRTATGAAGKLTMMMATGPNNAQAGWAFNVITRSSADYTNCTSTFRDYCLYRGSATQHDPVVSGGAWGFNSVTTGPENADWRSRAARIK